MKTTTTSATALASAANVHALVKEAFDAVGASFERCLMASQSFLRVGDMSTSRWGQAKAHGNQVIARVSATRRRVKR